MLNKRNSWNLLKNHILLHILYHKNLKRKEIYIRSQMFKNGRQICKKKFDCKQAKNLGFNMGIYVQGPKIS